MSLDVNVSIMLTLVYTDHLNQHTGIFNFHTSQQLLTRITGPGIKIMTRNFHVYGSFVLSVLLSHRLTDKFKEKIKIWYIKLVTKNNIAVKINRNLRKQVTERRYPCKNTHDMKGTEHMNTKDAVN
jgi:hypothetical protein